MTASSEGHVDIVRILIEANAQLNTQDEVYSQTTNLRGKSMCRYKRG